MADPVIALPAELIKGPRVYLGAGKTHRLDGWLHLDRHPFPGLDRVCDVTQGLPFDDHSVAAIYSQDFLEHLPDTAKVPLMNEIWRVLLPGGTMEHYVPNAGSRNDFGSPSHLSHFSLQQFEHFDVDSYRYDVDREYEGFMGGFQKVVAELVNWQVEDDGVRRAQSLHVIYRAVPPC